MSTAATQPTPRQVARAEMTARILSEARAQLGSVGPGELSLRAIAREIGVASSALYRYFPSRDELLTALLVQLYDELGQTLEDADAAVRARGNLGRRITAMARAMRGWAIAHPHDWALLYGSPVVGYRAPQDTIGPAGRSTGAFLTLLTAMVETGRSPRSEAPRLTQRSGRSLRSLEQQVGGTIPTDLLQRGMIAWTTMLGTISLELFGHLHRAVDDYPAYFDQVIARTVHDLGMD